MPGIQGDFSPKKENGYEMVSVEEVKTSQLTETPLIKAAKDGDLKSLNYYLDKGGNLTETYKGGTVLHWAAYNDNFDNAITCCEEIIRRTLLNSNNNLLSTLLNFGDPLRQSPIFWAATKGNYALIEIFLRNGAILETNSLNETVVHTIMELDDLDKIKPCVNILLDLKYYDNDSGKLRSYLNTERSGTETTALQLAAIGGYAEIIEKLIRSGADPVKVDHVGRNVFHRAAGNVFEDKAIACTRILLQPNLVPDWDTKKSRMLTECDIGGKCPLHIAARRGFATILAMLPAYFSISEAQSGSTVLHLAAALGNQHKAEYCVRAILDNCENLDSKNRILNAQDKDGCTPLYLAAANRNIEAAKLLLLAGSHFDIRTKRGKTPLEKVYEKIPQAVSVLLDEAVKNSGYVEHINSVNARVQLDFGPILGYSTLKSNIYKETEELAKVCYAKFDDRKEILRNPFIRIYIFEKWKKIRWFFITFRILHIIWFLCNFFLLVSMYRVHCPSNNAKPFSWTSLRPLSDTNVTSTGLAECEVPRKLYWSGILNLGALLIYFFSQFHTTKQRLHWIFRPMKPIDKDDTTIFEGFLLTIGYYVAVIFRIFPCWPTILGIFILISTLPILGIQVLDETRQYMVAGGLGLLVWLAIYLEVGKVPRFRVYVNLLMRSTRTLLLAIMVTAPILFGFATVFVVLMPGEPSFTSAAQSFVKVITFMIGELDYEGLFYEDGKENIFSGIVMLALAIFIVIIVVLLVNFLIGLAAEEIRDFWERAEIWKLCTQLEQIVLLESFLDETVPICGRGFLRRNLMLMPPERKNEEVVKQRRKAFIKISQLPQKLQKELHELNLKTIGENR